jgi:hypothetical protein
MDEIGERTGDLAFGIERLQGGEVEVSRWLWLPLCKYCKELTIFSCPGFPPF